jgi:hypothetical protein
MIVDNGVNTYENAGTRVVTQAGRVASCVEVRPFIESSSHGVIESETTRTFLAFRASFPLRYAVCVCHNQVILSFAWERLLVQRVETQLTKHAEAIFPRI